jgi:DNA-binding IclR family transcriptional regulator
VQTANRVLSVLALFTMERPNWTVEAAMQELGLSRSTAYNYFRSLVDAGLLVSIKTGVYSIGPEIISFDRIMRRHDPLMHNAQGAMRRLGGIAEGESISLLCRRFREQVMCVDQYAARTPSFAISYERGRPMPLYRGSASKVILANLPSDQTRRIWDRENKPLTTAGLGTTRDEFKRTLRALRRENPLVVRGELDQGLICISSPVFGADEEVCGSLSIVATASRLDKEPAILDTMQTQLAQEAGALSAALLG